jgi:hypothetical protein
MLSSASPCIPWLNYLARVSLVQFIASLGEHRKALEGKPKRRHAEFDNTLAKALARAIRWKRMLESGNSASLNKLAESEKVNPSYVRCQR